MSNYKVEFYFEDYTLGVDIFKNKDHLIKSFYSDFYEFIITQPNGLLDLNKKNIYNKEDFIVFASDWYADGMENCYGVGHAFNKYYLEKTTDANINSQNNETFIGFLNEKQKYTVFLDFLITFFAWWRNDEKYTTFNPYNYGDQFFYDSWAALVDTAKLFYFTAETVYHWQSFRVKYALDNIPGVILSEFAEEINFEGELLLPKLRVAGFEFKGWFTIQGKEVTTVKNDLKVYAKLVKKDTYNYWDTEEPLQRR